MANAVQFAGANMVLGAPEGAENVSSLHTFTNGRCSVSCWELDDAELEEIVRSSEPGASSSASCQAVLILHLLRRSTGMTRPSTTIPPKASICSAAASAARSRCQR
jgi:hypothetical protein